MLRTSLTDLLQCRAPVQQSPMGGVSTPELAVAVAEAGGVGTVTALGLDNDRLRQLLDDMVRRTEGVLAANFLTADIDRAAVAIAAARVRVVDFFWADPDRALVALAHDGGALVNWQVGSIEEARAAVAAGCDLVTVQGVEAGGHVRGHDALLPLLSLAVDELAVPVMASGGVADARGLAAVLAAGAVGARIGTRFVATQESGAHPSYKAALVGASGADTQISDAFSICPLCATVPRARVLDSAVAALRRLEGGAVGEFFASGTTVPMPGGSGLPPVTAMHGRIEAMAMYAGMGTGLVRDIPPAAEVVDRLCSGAETLLNL